MKKSIVLCSLITALGLFYSCKKNYEPSVPAGTAYLDLPATPYNYYPFFGDSAKMNKAATLGRVLFYDNHLSVNNSVACASCHKQSLAFSDNVAFSRGFENRLTGRNSMPIQNLREAGFGGSSTLLFWDGRERIASSLIARPITNHVEMGISDMNALAEKLSTLPYYKSLFKDAYGTEIISSENISDAVSKFMLAIMADNTRYDQRRQNKINFSAQELKGEALFNTTYNCQNCHRVESFGYMGESAFNIGLDIASADKGVGAVTGRVEDMGRFKIPSLRNVALTAPYMHDGRFAKLEDVLEHYSHGIQNSANLDSKLKDENGQALRMNISDDDKKAIIAFLNTLTDHTMITDPKFSNPFKTK